MHYRRVYLPGGYYFFTLVVHDRQPLFRDSAAVATFSQAFRQVRARYPFETLAIVLLPDHLHCIWRLPSGDEDYSLRWRLIKTAFTRHYTPSSRGFVPRHRSARQRHLQGSYWQPRFWEHTLRDERDLRRHQDYIHFNPVKHRLVASVNEWPHSSFHRYVRSGWYSPTWGGEGVPDAMVTAPEVV